MAPPHLPRQSKSSLPTTQRAPRQEPRQMQKGSEDHSNDTDELYSEAETRHEEPQDTSVQTLMNEMVGTQRRRHTAKKQSVLKTYDTAVKALGVSINALFDDHEKKASTAHDAQLKRLKELMQRKAQIEAAMAEKSATLKSSYEAHSRDLESVLAARIKDLD